LFAVVAVLFCAVGLLDWSERAHSPAASEERTAANTNPAKKVGRLNDESITNGRGQSLVERRAEAARKQLAARIASRHRLPNNSMKPAAERMRVTPHHPGAPKYREGAAPDYSNDNYSKTGRQPPQPGSGVRSIEDVVATWRADQVEAAKITVSQQSILESSPEQTDKINPDEVFNRISAEFQAETNSERQIALLSKTVDSGVDQNKSRKFLEEAVNSHQPVDVRRQALYLLTQMDSSKAKEIAGDPANPLQLDAQAFLLQDQIASGNVPPPVADP
jgi:hypothetical protein